MVITGTASYSGSNTQSQWQFWDGTKKKAENSQTCCTQDWRIPGSCGNTDCRQPKTEGWRTTAASTNQPPRASASTTRNCSNTYPQHWVIEQASKVPAGEPTLQPTAGELKLKNIKKLHIDWQNDLIGANFKNIRLAFAHGMHNF